MLKKTILVALLTVGLSLPSLAQDTVFMKSFLSSLDAANDKIVQLAMEFPEDKYDARPAEGVRSVKEALMHVAGANMFFASRLGAEMPADMQNRNLEKDVTSKEEAVKVLKQSIEFARKTVMNMSESDMAKEMDWFDGSKVPTMQMVLLVGDHANEHLGQLIAYARANDVVPPWSN